MDSHAFSLPVQSSLCCGCTACTTVCPKGAITMQQDKEGFLSPVLDDERCIGCHLCIKVCPVLSPCTHPAPAQVQAAWIKDEPARLAASSGGISVALARSILRSGGVVVGAAMEGFHARHVLVEKESDLPRIMGSKYVQSDLGNMFQQIDSLLREGRRVFFTGTPCQVAGLRNALRRDDDLLLTADVICHGVPSPGVLLRYVDELKDRFYSAVTCTFRNKHGGWSAFHEFSLFDEEGRALFHDPGRSNVYLRGFLRNVFNRSCCGSCRFASPERTGDITLADFWGVAQIDPDLNDRKGTSLVFLNTEKGASAYDAIRDDLAVSRSVPVEAAVERQAQLRAPARISPLRPAFFEVYRNGGSLIDFLEKQLFPVGVLNFHFANNFGANLVPYSLCKAIEKLGYPVEVINYLPVDVTPVETFRDFRSRYLRLSREFRDMKSLEANSFQWKRIVAGSDQIWRMYDTGTYMLKWASGQKSLISYAASFGHDRYAGRCRWQEASALLKRFDAVSVREASGVDICRETFGVPAVQLIDPTLLLTEQEYASFIEKEAPASPEGKYVCTVIINRVNVEKLREDQSLFADIKATYRLENALRGPDGWRSVAGWLECIRKAEYVIADSFHGVVFSILFQKQFLCLVTGVNGLGRIPSLLKTLGIPESRIYSSMEQVNLACFEEKIDYRMVAPRLEAQRQKGMDFLRRSLHKAPTWKEKPVILSQTPGKGPSREDMAVLAQQLRVIRKYYWYKFLSKVTSGERRKHYLKKRWLWKKRIRSLREWKKKLRRVL